MSAQTSEIEHQLEQGSLLVQHRDGYFYLLEWRAADGRSVRALRRRGVVKLAADLDSNIARRFELNKKAEEA